MTAVGRRRFHLGSTVLSRHNAMRAWLRGLLGSRGERAAARYLRRRGYRVLAQAWRSRLGDIDLVVSDEKRIVFVEVKTRSSTDAGHPAEAVTEEKQRRLTRLALQFLRQHGLLEHPTRFDVVAVSWPAGRREPSIEHVQNAFEAGGAPGMYS